MEKGINVLSLFDGISGGRIALDRAGIKVDKYYASEVDKYAVKVASHNWPETVQLGDVTKWREWNIDWSSIDLVIGGFPCQSWSLAGKQMGDKDPRGMLFWTFLDVIKKVLANNSKAKFLMENVKMKKEFEDYITFHTEEALGYVDKHLINSELVSAQRRKRFYWTNIRGITQPKDKGIMLKDVVHENTWTYADKCYCIDANYFKGGNAEQYYNKARRQQVFDILKEYIVPFDKTLQILDKEVQRGKVGYFRKDSQANRVYHIHDKAVTLTGEAGGGAAKMGMYLFGCITPVSSTIVQDNRRFNDDKKFYTLTGQGEHGILIEGYIRKLTPVECERLQTIEDGYTEVEGVSNTQRYKQLGNGWTVDVIAHIFSFLK